MPVEVILLLQPNKNLSSKAVSAPLAGQGLLQAACPGLPLPGMALAAHFPGEEPGLTLSTFSLIIHRVALGCSCAIPSVHEAGPGREHLASHRS